MQDPSPYLQQLGVALSCLSDPNRPAQLDDEHLARVNYELFYFADQSARLAFVQDPRSHCGALTDPVSKRRFRPGTEAPRIDFAGRPWFFASDSTRALFAAMPDSFLSPRFQMKPKPGAG